MCLITLKYFKTAKLLKQQKALTKTIIENLDDNTLAKIKRKCESYQTYAIDNKQLNKKYYVSTQQKLFLELAELCKAQEIINAFELSTKENKISGSITSTFDEESKPVKESKKKEKTN